MLYLLHKQQTNSTLIQKGEKKMNYKFSFENNRLVKDFDNDIVISVLGGTGDEADHSIEINNRDELAKQFTQEWLEEHLVNGGTFIWIFECENGSIESGIELSDFDGETFADIYDAVENIILDY